MKSQSYLSLCYLAFILLLNVETSFSSYVTTTRYENQSLIGTQAEFSQQVSKLFGDLSSFSNKQCDGWIFKEMSSYPYPLMATYADLPLHEMIYYSFDYYSFTTNSEPQAVVLEVNSKQMQIDIGSDLSSSTCFASLMSSKTRVYGRIKHNDTSQFHLEIQAVSGKPDSFAIKNIIVYFRKTPTGQDESICGFDSFLSTFCDSSPEQCHESCNRCFGSSSSECYECSEGYGFNGTDCVKCDSSCTNCTGSAKNQCITCNSGRFLFNENTCLETCPSPLQSSTQTPFSCKLPSIDLPYRTPSYFLDWSNSLNDSCKYPLQTEDIGGSGVSFCRSPCNSNSYLYWNSSCRTNCDPSLFSPKQDNTKKFCYPKISPEQYIAQNGSTLSLCEPPLRVTTDNMFGSLCLPPCNDPLMYYFQDSKKCSYECQGVMQVSPQGFLICQNSTSSPSDPSMPSTLVLESGIIFDSVFLAPIEPGTVTFVALVKLMQYVRYIEINMPPRLERMAVSKGRTVLSLQAGPEVTNTIYSWFYKHISSYLIEKQRFHSKFLANFGGNVFVLLIIVSLALTFSIFNAISKRFEWTKAQVIFQKLQILTKWNFCLMLFGTYLDDIILYSAFEFTTVEFETSSTYISFIGCLLILIATLAFLFIPAIIIRRARMINPQKSKTKVSSNANDSLGKYSSFQVFFIGFKDNIIINQFFYLIYVIRAALPIFLAVTLIGVPIAQAALQVAISIIIVSYILFARPLRNKINQLQLAITEIIVLGLNSCVLALAILDSKGDQNTQRYELLGDIIILGNVTLNFLVIVFLVIKLIFMIKDIRTLYRKSPFNALASCIHLVVLPLQQGAFGFEDLLGDINPGALANDKKQIANPKSIFPLDHSNSSGFINTSYKSNEVITVKNIGGENISTIGNPSRISNFDIASEMSITERLGQSSARLMVGSQIITNNQGISHTNDTMMKEHTMDNRWQYNTSAYSSEARKSTVPIQSMKKAIKQHKQIAENNKKMVL